MDNLLNLTDLRLNIHGRIFGFQLITLKLASLFVRDIPFEVL